MTVTYGNGLVRTNGYDETGALARATWDVTSAFCSSGCNWFDFTVGESGFGQVRTDVSQLTARDYSYDPAGRLVRAQDIVWGGCQTRDYGFDANTNRTSLTVRDSTPSDWSCPTAGGATTTSSYDEADRLTGSGYGYDSFGRTSSTPGGFTFGYYSNDRARTIGDGTNSRTFGLDAARRVRTVADTTDGQTRMNHYAADGDVPAWTAENTAGTAWTRYVDGAGGMAASIDQANVVTYQLTNPRGDVIATAGVDVAGPTLLSVANTDEYGQNRTTNPLRRYQYVGTARRWTDTATNTVLMGARLYQPTTGRFLQIDPVEGGSANNYDYVAADPVNQLDLNGEGGCPPWLHRKRHDGSHYCKGNAVASPVTYVRNHAATIGSWFVGASVATFFTMGCSVIFGAPTMGAAAFWCSIAGAALGLLVQQATYDIAHHRKGGVRRY